MENKQTNPPAAQENIMGTMAINPLLVKLSIPMMVSMLVQALYNVVDSIFVSHVSEGALTAVSLAFSLQNMMIAVGVGTGVGVNALLSKSLGEKDQERANKTAENGIFLALCSFAAFFIIGLTCMKPYFYAQTSDVEIAEQGIRYLTVCSVFSLGLFLQTMSEKLLAAGQDVVTITSADDLPLLLRMFPAPALTPTTSGWPLVVGTCYDVAFENGMGRILTLTYQASDTIQVTLTSIYPARAIALLEKDDYRISASLGATLGGLRSIRMENAESIRLHAQGEEALYVMITPLLEENSLRSIAGQMTLTEGE